MSTARMRSIISSSTTRTFAGDWTELIDMNGLILSSEDHRAASATLPIIAAPIRAKWRDK
jgi:hypothetical protein